jgi:membrane protein DedA with SNARE-associated domain
VYVVLVLGAVVGGQAMWALGRRIGAGRERPRFLRGPRASKALTDIALHFDRHGTLFLVVHRFIPALRAFVFVGAGMSGLSFWRVLVFGGLSAVLWNGALFGVAWLVASSWDRLERYLSIYSWVVLALLVVVAIVFFVRRRARRTERAEP